MFLQSWYIWSWKTHLWECCPVEIWLLGIVGLLLPAAPDWTGEKEWSSLEPYSQDAVPEHLLCLWYCETLPEPKGKGDSENNFEIKVAEKWYSHHLADLWLAVSGFATPNKLAHCYALEKALLQVEAG